MNQGAIVYILLGIVVTIGGLGVNIPAGIFIAIIYWIFIPVFAFKDALNPAEHKTAVKTLVAGSAKICPKCKSSHILTSTDDHRQVTYHCKKCGYTWRKDNFQPTPFLKNDVQENISYVSKHTAPSVPPRLINCPACKHQISNQAVSCPYCGQPIAANSNRCPKCHSADIRKVDSFERSVDTYVWGLGSGKIGKSYKCNHCGNMW